MLAYRLLRSDPKRSRAPPRPRPEHAGRCARRPPAKAADEPPPMCDGFARNGHGLAHHHLRHTTIEAGVVVASGSIPSSPTGLTRVGTPPAEQTRRPRPPRPAGASLSRP